MQETSLTSAQRRAIEMLALAVGIDDQDRCPSGEIDDSQWQEIRKELKIQALFPLVAEVAMTMQLSGEAQMDCMKEAGKNMRYFHRILLEQDALFELLEKEDIPAVVLKGSAAAIYYSKPEYRTMGDIDILVDKADFERACKCLTEKGYKPDSQSLGDQRHIEFTGANGLSIELHHHFSSSANTVQNEILDGYISDGISRRKHRELCGHSFYMLPPVENGLVLLAHINQHLYSGLGFRQIIDWMLYVRAFLDDRNWESQFCTMAEQIGMRTLAETVTLMCKRHLGLEGTITWCDGADSDLADELFVYALEKGNFGRRNLGNTKSVRVMNHFRDPIEIVRYLYECGMLHWKAAQKYPILRPFAWIYFIRYLLKCAMKRHASIADYLSEIKQSKKELDLLKRLKVTRMK